MKKCICFVLVLALLVTTVAFAADTLSFRSKTGKYAPTIKTKTSATGSSGSVTVSSNAGGHSMYYHCLLYTSSTITNTTFLRATEFTCLSECKCYLGIIRRIVYLLILFTQDNIAEVEIPKIIIVF